MAAVFTLGDVVRNEVRWGPRPTSHARTCPGCHRFVSQKASHCPRCALTFVPLTEGYVQIIGTRHAS